MATTAVVIAAIGATLVVIGVVLKQGSVGRLSEEAGRPPARDGVVERPAGVAEPTHPDPPGHFPDDSEPPVGGDGP